MDDSGVTVVVADAFRLRAIRSAPPFTGRVLYFSDASLGSAFESIRSHQPLVIALESHFAYTSQGRAFLDRLRSLPLAASAVQILSRADTQWSTRLSIPVHPAATVTPIAPVALVTGVDSAPALAAALADGINTRRVPRFPLLDPLAMRVDGLKTSLVDMSIMGAQVLSAPVLRPNQRLTITLPDVGNSFLSVSAFVAWSTFETPRNAPQPRPYYRAGMEFTDAAVQTLEAFCKRHCSDEPSLRR